MSDIIKRLRTNSGWRNGEMACITSPNILIEAADLIETLLVENENLKRALEPFAKEADGRKRKDIRGGVCFSQPLLLQARATLKGINYD